MIRLATVLALLLFSSIMFGQDAYSRDHRSEFQLGYGLGGNWYLNALDNNPKWTIHFKQSIWQKGMVIRLGVGYEQLEDEAFIPVYLNLSKTWPKGEIGLDVGYAHAFSRIDYGRDNFEYYGGPQAHIYYQYPLISQEGYSWWLGMGYDMRRSIFEYEFGPDAEETSRLYFHHLRIFTSLRI
jgi:hypothetical protein